MLLQQDEEENYEEEEKRSEVQKRKPQKPQVRPLSGANSMVGGRLSVF